MKLTVFVVTAYKFGDRENHSYTLGVFRKKNEAIKAADRETIERGGKYGCEVDEMIIDHHYDDIQDEPKTVYKTKSLWE